MMQPGCTTSTLVLDAWGADEVGDVEEERLGVEQVMVDEDLLTVI
jgi:hypothetical protein